VAAWLPSAEATHEKHDQDNEQDQTKSATANRRTAPEKPATPKENQQNNDNEY